MSSVEKQIKTDAFQSVARERQRQVVVYGYNAKHDDRYRAGELIMAAGAYTLFSQSYPEAGSPPGGWPWSPYYWTPGPNKRRDLVKAAALLIAEIERIDRAEVLG